MRGVLMKNKMYQYTGRSLFEAEQKPIKLENYLFALAMIFAFLTLVF